ncbi:Omega-lycotoxin-Gsp2671f like [Actinidia chinensis var. chinensis]|uniref:Omega-lycotoxin-Gsp2671f like n=1 Tax=Actinidia chinensis var. chinensis TaxID=1590841 RepID=A0A2R6QFC1_ACTCC|nr:Omega-lycotoxin-Gsp2671f like [Actinidia chinensis var. chinensis]
MGLALSTKVKLKRTRPSMKILSIQQHARDTLSRLRMRKRNRNWIRNQNHMGWGNLFEGCTVQRQGYVAAGLRGQEQGNCRGCTVQRQGCVVRSRGCWWWGCVAAGQTGLRGCCLDYTRHKAAQCCAWLHGAGAGQLVVAVEAWAAGGGC